MRKFKLKIERDNLRMFQQHFFPYITMLLDHRIRNHHSNQPDAEKLTDLLLQSVFSDIQRIVDRRLTGEANRFTINFSNAQVIALNALLNQVPVPENQIYMQLQRQQLCDQLYRWINEPK